MASVVSAESAALPAGQVAQLLHTILHSTDNNERRAVEATIVRSLAHPATLMELVNVLCSSSGDAVQSAGVRQLAAVLLRKKIFSLWSALDAAQQAQLRQLLLQQLGAEPVRVVRFAIAHIVTRLAKADANRGGGGWPELQQAVRVAVEDPRAEMRELAMVLVYSFAEVFSDANALGGLAAESVVRGVADSELVVQTAAVKAAGVLVPFLAEQPTVRGPFLQHLVPQCVQLLYANAALDAKAALCVSVLDLLEQLLEELSVKKNGELLVSMANSLAEMLVQPALNLRVRQSIGSTLSQLVTLKPKFVVSHKLLQPLMEACVQVMAEDATISLPDPTDGGVDGGDDDDADDNDGAGGDGGAMDASDEDELDLLHVSPPCMIGGRLLSTLATSVAAKAFTSTLVPFLSAVTDGTHPRAEDPLMKKSCMVALACLAEGHSSYLRRRVGYVLDVTQRYLRDENPIPREAAAFSLAYFSLHLQPEILTHHTTLLPMLVPLLADESDLVRRRVAEALDRLCENVAEDLEPYVDTLLPAVLQAISSGSSLETQRGLCGVIASMAMTRCPSFRAHAPAVLELLKQPFAIIRPETAALRAQVTESVGVVAGAMGKEAFKPFFPFFMAQVVENLKTRNATLREQSFGFLTNMCELLKEEFLPFLDDSLACALQTIEEDRAVYKNKHLLAAGSANLPLAMDDDEKEAGAGAKDNSDDDENADGGAGDAEEIHLRVRTADVEEKASAVYCVGVFAEVLLSSFGVARVERCWEPLASLDSHYYDNIRSNAMVAAAKLTKASHGSAEVVKSFTANTLDQRTRDLVDELLQQTLLPTMRNEMEKDVVAAACEAVTSILNFFGPQAFPFGPDELVKLSIQLLRQKLPCQGVEEDLESDDSGDGVEGAGVDDGLFDVDEADGAEAGSSAAPFSAVTATAGAPGSSSRRWQDRVTPAMALQNVQLSEGHDEIVFEAAADMLEALAKAYGPACAEYFPYFLPLLALYADPATRPPEDLVTAVGCIAMLLQGAGPAAASAAFDDAVQLCFSVIAASDESTARANSCFLLRVLVESCPERFADMAAVQQTLQALWAVAGSAEEIPEAVDNAMSATCSLVRCLPPTLVPLDAVVPSMLAGIPMRIDRSENANAGKTLVYLLTSPQVAAVSAKAVWLPALAGCVANFIASRTEEEKEKAELVSSGVVPFVQQYATAWGTARATLTPEQQAALQGVGC